MLDLRSSHSKAFYEKKVFGKVFKIKKKHHYQSLFFHRTPSCDCILDLRLFFYSPEN